MSLSSILKAMDARGSIRVHLSSFAIVPSSSAVICVGSSGLVVLQTYPRCIHQFYLDMGLGGVLVLRYSGARRERVHPVACSTVTTERWDTRPWREPERRIPGPLNPTKADVVAGSGRPVLRATVVPRRRYSRSRKKRT
jgi:hypothetical protein